MAGGLRGRDVLAPGEGPPPALPLFGVPPRQLRGHPGLERLLRGLGQRLGPDGLSEGLRRELREAQAGLSLSRGAWLRWETLWRGAQELLRDPHPLLPPPVLQALERGLALAQLRRGPPAFAPLLPPPQVLGRCRRLLAQLSGGPCAGARAALDGHRGRYLEAKGGALLLKIRSQELALLRDTYPPPTLEAHRRIRATLESAYGRSREEASRAREALAAFGGLGARFGAKAREYGQLRERLERRRWDLQQLRGANTQ